MQHWFWIGLTAGCGQMAQAPAQPAQPPPVQPAMAPSLAGDPPPPDEPGPPPVDETEASYAAARPAGPARPTRSAHRAAPDEATAWVDAHNRVREKHCAKPLTWSPQLAQVAQRWASSLRDKGCAFGHSGGKFGENLAAGTTGTLDPESVVKMWYDEVAQYRFPNGGFSMKTGHFTQVVWRGTTQVGCGRSHCNDLDIFVCEYNPAGNWEGEYRENVLPPGCR